MDFCEFSVGPTWLLQSSCRFAFFCQIVVPSFLRINNKLLRETASRTQTKFFITFQSFFNYFNNSIDLLHSNYAEAFQKTRLRSTLWYTASNYDKFTQLLSFFDFISDSKIIKINGNTYLFELTIVEAYTYLK